MFNRVHSSTLTKNLSFTNMSHKFILLEVIKCPYLENGPYLPQSEIIQFCVPHLWKSVYCIKLFPKYSACLIHNVFHPLITIFVKFFSDFFIDLFLIIYFILIINFLYIFLIFKIIVISNPH